MKNILVLVIIFIYTSLFGYTAKMTVTVDTREIKVQISYEFTGDAVKIDLPKRAKLIGINSPGKANVAFYQSESTIRIDTLTSQYGGKINLTYMLPIQEPEFYREDWLAECDQKGDITATLSLPNGGYKGLFVPYESKGDDGYVIHSQDKPILVVGKFKNENDSVSGKVIEMYYQFKLITPVKTVSKIIESCESMLAPLEQKHIVLIALPALQSTIRFSGGNLFIILNGTSTDEVKRTIGNLYFKGILHLDDDTVFAFSDYVKRSLDEGGKSQLDDIYYVPVPAYSYYENVISKGFTTGNEINCDVNSMIKNFALLDMAYYTLGNANFQIDLKNFVEQAKQGKTNFREAFQSQAAGTKKEATNETSSDTSDAVDFTCDKLLPVAKFIPDLSIKGQNVYRNADSIPNIFANINGTKQPVVWGNKRGVDIGQWNGYVFLDPGNKIPQLNYFNDKAFSDKKDIGEWTLVAESAAKHKRIPEESFREILNMEKFRAQDKNAYGLTKDTVVYVAIVKFYAPSGGKLVTGLKELVISMADGKPNVVGYRVRL